MADESAGAAFGGRATAVVLLALLAASGLAGPRPEIAFTVQRRGTLGPRAVLDVAFMGTEQWLVLFADEVALYRWSDGGPVKRAQQPLPGPAETVRHPGGRLRAVEAESAFWVLTSVHAKAALYALEDGRIVPRDQADALPWPGVATGLRYRAGTDWLLGNVEGLGAGPFLALTAAGDPAAIAPDGRLVGDSLGPAEDLRLGAALAPLWPGYLAASLPVPPGEPDAILVLARGPSGARIAGRFAVDGAIRALAAHVETNTARLLVASEDDRGLGLLEIRLERTP